ncbi:MAG: hypothetical protein ABIT04_01510 [Novosphingobium sp.]
MNGATIVAIIGVLMALVLASRGFRRRGLTGRSALLATLGWIAIIGVLAIVLQRSGAVAIWRQ